MSPTPAQEQLLRACFIPAAAAGVDTAQVDEASLRLLPLLYRRRGREEGRPVYLVLWSQNQQRIAQAAELVQAFAQAGIDSLLLKGLAVTISHYRDAGLRAMGDIDLLVRAEDVGEAAEVLQRAGWKAEGGLSTREILRQRRVRHAWQFSRGAEESCDLHWRPVVRCFSPLVDEWFRRDAVPAELAGVRAKVPCPTDQFFHACVHGAQWNWTPQIRWIADALVILESGPVDAARLRALAAEADMTVRLGHALDYLRWRFDARIPDCLPARLPKWEEREHIVLQKPCPLGVRDSVQWHWWNLRRIRQFDRVGLAEYLALFLHHQGAGLLGEVWRRLRAV